MQGVKQGGDAVGTLRALLRKQQGDMQTQAAQQAFEGPLKERHAAVEEQNAATMAGYRADQAHNMEEQRRVDKLKLLMGAGGGGVGADGKPLSSEAQKTYNLADTARDSLNATEAFTKENPKASAIASIPLVGWLGSKLGGPVKEAYDTRNSAKEALQNLYTGAAASGEQVPAFQSFAGPGIVDAWQGKGGVSDSTRDAINNFQQGLHRQVRPLTPEMLEAAEMEDDPMAQQLMQQQEAKAQMQQNAKLQKLSPQDRELYRHIAAEPNHPNAAAAKRDLERKYGKLF